MPNIYINEIDETTGGVSLDVTDVAFVPGFAERNSNVYIYYESGKTPNDDGGVVGTLYEEGASIHDVIYPSTSSIGVRVPPMFATNVVDKISWICSSVTDTQYEWETVSYIEPTPENVPTLCTDLTQFKSLFGDKPFRFNKDEYPSGTWDSAVDYPDFEMSIDGDFYKDGDYERSYIYARELINLGLPVLYDNVVARSESTGQKILPSVSLMYNKLGEIYSEELSDKNEYSVKYLTSGAYPVFEFSGVVEAERVIKQIGVFDTSVYQYTAPEYTQTVTVEDEPLTPFVVKFNCKDESSEIVAILTAAQDSPYTDDDEYNPNTIEIVENGFKYSLGANKEWAEGTVSVDWEAYNGTTYTIEDTPSAINGCEFAKFYWSDSEQHTLVMFADHYVIDGVTVNDSSYHGDNTFTAEMENGSLTISNVTSGFDGNYILIKTGDEAAASGTLENGITNEVSELVRTYNTIDNLNGAVFTPSDIELRWSITGDDDGVIQIRTYGEDANNPFIDANGNQIEIVDGGFQSKSLPNIPWAFTTNSSVSYSASAISKSSDPNGGIMIKMLECAGESGENGRGDCVAIIDHTNIPNRPLTGETSVYNKLAELNLANAEFGTMFTPWAIYNVVAENKEVPVQQVMPASFGYLLSLAKSIKNNPNWFAIAGAARGMVPYIKSLNTVQRLSNKIANDMQQRNGKTSINPITEIKPYGLLIWGNRTLKNNSIEGNLTATSFLNIRNLVSDVKKQAYITAKKYMFEQNNDILWVNFKSGLTPLLDRMQSGQGLSGYKIIKGTTQEKAKVVATIKLYPVYAVEDFEITVVISDEEVTVE